MTDPLEQISGLLLLLRPKTVGQDLLRVRVASVHRGFIPADAICKALVAFVLFCLESLATHIVNDIQDIEPDRRPPGKSRACASASGSLSALLALSMPVARPGLLFWGWFFSPGMIGAIRLRRQVGTQAEAIKRLAGSSADHKPLRERMRHSHIEIAAGIVRCVGAAVGLALHQLPRRGWYRDPRNARRCDLPTVGVWGIAHHGRPNSNRRADGLINHPHEVSKCPHRFMNRT